MNYELSSGFGKLFNFSKSLHAVYMSETEHVALTGLGIGSLSSPPLAGWVFMLSPLNVLYTVGVMVTIQCLAVLFMWTVARKTSVKQSNNGY